MTLKNTILLFLISIFSFSMLFAQNEQPEGDLETYLTAQNISAKSTDTGLFYELTKEGTGRKPKMGDYLALNFKGKLLDGTIFEESDPADPFVFQVGYRQVIRGWDLGIREFPLGSKGTIYISAAKCCFTV